MVYARHHSIKISHRTVKPPRHFQRLQAFSSSPRTSSLLVISNDFKPSRHFQRLRVCLALAKFLESSNSVAVYQNTSFSRVKEDLIALLLGIMKRPVHVPIITIWWSQCAHLVIDAILNKVHIKKVNNCSRSIKGRCISIISPASRLALYICPLTYVRYSFFILCLHNA